MISHAKRFIDNAQQSNSKTERFFKRLIVIFVIVGIVVVFLSCYITSWISLAEVVIGGGLIWSIRGLTTTNTNNKDILKECGNIFKTGAVSNQQQLKRKLRAK